MNITKTIDGEKMTMAVVGRLDALTSADFDAEVGQIDAAVKFLTFDFSALDFISSAGLRVIVMALKTMKGRGGDVKITGVNATVLNILQLTGMSAVLGVS